MRPEDLAEELGLSGKTIRAWLRERYPRTENQKHQPWSLSTAQEKAVRERFSERRRRAPSREKMIVTTIALPGRMHARLMRVARKERLALTEAVRQAVGEWLDRAGERR